MRIASRARRAACSARRSATASGSLVEFESAETIARAYPQGVRELADHGGRGTIAGQPTDDTEMALALARSMLAAGRYDAKAAFAAYRAWLASVPIDIGRTTRAALEGTPDLSSEANGSLMRASPIGVWAAGDPARAARPRAKIQRSRTPTPYAAMPAPPTPLPSPAALRAAAAMPCCRRRSRMPLPIRL